MPTGRRVVRRALIPLSMFTKIANNLLIVSLAFGMLFASCSKDDAEEVDPNAKNTVVVEFDNRVGDQKLALGTTPYTNGSGEDFTVTTFNYFVSNIVLKKDDGTVVPVPNQYFLIRQADARSQTIQLRDVPAGDYSAMSFTVGVDSLKSLAPVAERTGALDVTSYGDDGMYWSWNSGYIFLKLEGISSVVPARTDGRKLFQMHVGGFGGGYNGGARTVNNLRTVTLPIVTKATVRGNTSPTIHLLVDVKKIFDGSTKISLATTNNVHNPAIATTIAENYKSMFVVDHVHNDQD